MSTDLPPSVWLTLSGNITGETTQKVFAGLANVIARGAEDVHILLQSFGGSIGDGIAIYNYLRNLPVQVTMYNAGHVASAAVPVYLSGQRRIAERTAAFLIHKSNNQPPVALRAAELQSVAQQVFVDDKRMLAVIREHTTIPKAKWKTVDLADLTLDAEQALKYGLIHEYGSFAPLQGQLFNL